MINWNNPKDKISKYFTVHEATYLPKWNCCHAPSDIEKTEILKLAAIMDVIREQMGSPITVHCWIRPNSVNCPGNIYHGQDYNSASGSTAKRSAHIYGQAVDFSVKGVDFKKVKDILLPQLEFLGLRMEKATTNWIHLDIAQVINNRYF
jgi:uncharacterized protein YcbK (DUF882 family)